MTAWFSGCRWRRVPVELGKAACYLALFLGWQILVSYIYSAVISMKMTLTGSIVDQKLLYDAMAASAMEISLLSGLLTLCSVAAFFKLRRRSLCRELWLRPVPGSVLGWCGALSFCLYWLVTLVLACLPERWMIDYTDVSALLNQTGLTTFVATALVAPVVEEIVFRGLVFTRLRRVMPGWLAVAFSAVIFGVCHGELIWFCYAFVLGTIFALLVERTHSILPNLLMHVVFNATNEWLALLTQWEPGIMDMLVILALATVGTVFCALRVRRAISRMPMPFEPAVGMVTPESGRRPEQGTSQGEWDTDSDRGHKFPPIWR